MSHNKPPENNKNIIPLKGQFPRTQSQELIGSVLFKSLQRAIGREGSFFKTKPGLFSNITYENKKKIQKELLTHLSIDPDKLPPKFRELFHLDITDPHLDTQVKDIFRNSVSLHDKSDRIVFSDGKTIIFRNQPHLIHTSQDRKLTTGEKRRYDITTTFNTFEDIYSAIRSQHHAIESMKTDQTTCLALIEDTLALAHDIRQEWFGSKDALFQRKINEIITTLWNTKDYKKLAAVLYDLEQIAFKNRSVESNRVIGASNKITQRFENLAKMMDIALTRDLPLLEEILYQHEQALGMFLAQVTFKPDKSQVLKTYTNTIKAINPPGASRLYPFGYFYEVITQYYDKPEFIEQVVPQIRDIYETYQQEHREKLSNDNK